MPRATTPDAEQQRRQRISAALRGRVPVAAVFSRTPAANAARAASLRAYWGTVPARREAMRETDGRRLAARREAHKAARIDRLFERALREIRGRV